MDFSAGYLIATLITSTVGFSLFLYGKKQTRVPHLGVGVVLMVMPYFGGSVLWIAGSAAVLCLGLWLAVRRGL
ncbi:MAG: hypothetical protein ACI89X_003449 [Planctomycetota bacterium]|jgi:hypothetical protein